MEIAVDFILIVGIIITILILLLLLNAKKLDYSKIILIAFFTTILFVNIHAYASLHDLRVLYAITFLSDFTIVWFIGPLLLLYIQSLFKELNGLRAIQVIHFLPALFMLSVIGIPLLLTFGNNSVHFPYLESIESHQSEIVILRNIYCLAYLVYALHIFRRYRQQMKANFADLSEHDFGWVEKLLYISIAFISIDFLLRAYELVIDLLPFDYGFITMTFIIVFTIYLGYYGINQSKILLPKFLIHNRNPVLLEDEKQSNVTTRMAIKNVEEFKKLFEEKIKAEQYYLEEGLTLSQLAGYFDTTDKHVSVLLNQYLGCSFYDYINSFRVEEVKRKFASAAFADYTIMAIAYESGFNSKASFNRIFKKMTGVPPSIYRKNL